MNWIKKLVSFWGRLLSLPSKQKLDEETRKWSKKKQEVWGQCSTKYQYKLGNTKILRREGSFSKETRWIFKVLSGVDQGREYIAITKKIQVGRHPENLILLRDPKVSRFHAIFYCKGSRLFLEDLGSTNGTRLNGEIVLKKRTVLSGDLIKIGESIIQVIFEKD